MKKFLSKILLLISLVMILMTGILLAFGGYVDYFYEKFTTPKAHSLIVGDSRSMQGIQPALLNAHLQGDYELPILNYSFALAQVSYGPAYLESIGKKLDQDTKNGLFILSVSPWVLSTREKDDEQHDQYFETVEPPNNMLFVNMNPNFEYLFRNFSYFHFKAMFRQITKTHKDGWLEQQVTTDPSILAAWKKDQLVDMRLKSGKWKNSPYRIASLDKTVKYLSTYGKVFIVRMPVDQDIVAIEDQYWRDFDANMSKIGESNNATYLNFTRDNPYKTYDGNHLHNPEQVLFAKALCDSIKAHNKKQY